VLVFELNMGLVTGLLHELRSVPAEAAGDTADGATASDGGIGRTALSITVLRISGREALFAGSSGRCAYWNLRTGQLQREFSLPGAGDHAAVPSTLAAVHSGGREADAGGKLCLWVGMDTGSLAVFDVDSGELVRSFSCAGPEALVSLAHFPADGVVFALSAHRRVSVWDASTYACIQKYPAELMTCGADLSAMISASVKDPDLNLLMLAGVDGSLCVRRVSRRTDGKLNCVLLSFFELVSAEGAPITSLSYHEPTDTVVIGDAGCRVALLCKLKEQLGTSVQAQNEQRSAVRQASTPQRRDADAVGHQGSSAAESSEIAASPSGSQPPASPPAASPEQPSIAADAGIEASPPPAAPPPAPPEAERSPEATEEDLMPGGAPVSVGI